MKRASFPVSLAIGAALSIAALPAAAQAGRDTVSRGGAEPHAEQRTRPVEPPRPQPAAADHELTHTVQQGQGMAVESAAREQRGVRHQQGRVITDADYNASPSGTPPSRAGVRDGTSNTVLVSEKPAAPAPAGDGAPASANPFIPEVADEVLVAMENGDYSFSGDYVVVAVRHKAPVRLRAGQYRTPGGSILSIGNGRIAVHRSGGPDRPVIIGTVPNPSSVPAEPAASQPQQSDFGFVRQRASGTSDSADGASKVTVRGWDAKSKEAANDEIPHPGTERVGNGEQ